MLQARVRDLRVLEDQIPHLLHLAQRLKALVPYICEGKVEHLQPPHIFQMDQRRVRCLRFAQVFWTRP
jgi:hypothetical protein